MGAYLAEVLSYWHRHVDRPELDSAKRYHAWYSADDGSLTEHFGDLVETLLAEPTGARDIPNTAATVIVLDQFVRKVYGRSARAYSGHDQAAAIALPLLQDGAAGQLELIEQIALAMAAGNTEDLGNHDHALDWFAAAASHLEGDDLALLHAFQDIAGRRREIIRQYGRFPVRNQPLGRTGTPGEAYFVVGTAFEYE